MTDCVSYFKTSVQSGYSTRIPYMESSKKGSAKPTKKANDIEKLLKKFDETAKKGDVLYQKNPKIRSSHPKQMSPVKSQVNSSQSDFRIAKPRVPSLKIPTKGWKINPPIRVFRKNLMDYIDSRINSKSLRSAATITPLVHSVDETEAFLTKAYPGLTLDSSLQQYEDRVASTNDEFNDSDTSNVAYPPDWLSRFGYSLAALDFKGIEDMFSSVLNINMDSRINHRLIANAAHHFEAALKSGKDYEHAFMEGSKFLRSVSSITHLIPGFSSLSKFFGQGSKSLTTFSDSEPLSFDQAAGHAPVQMKNSKDGSCHVTGTVPICLVAAPSTAAIKLAALSGSTSLIGTNDFGLFADALGGRLALIASLFSFIKYEHFKIIYTPLVPAVINVGADLVIAYAPDPGAGTLSAIAGYSDAIQLEKVCTNAVWSKCTLDIPIKTDWVFNESQNTNVSSLRQVSPGSIFIYASANSIHTGDLNLGTISVEFECRMKCPTATYGMTLVEVFRRKYGSDAMTFLLEGLITDPTLVFETLKELDYTPEKPVTDEILSAMKLCGFTPRLDPINSKFLKEFSTYCGTN